MLVAALVAAGVAVRSQRAAQRASLAAEQASVVAGRTALLADANRLAELSATVDSLDLAYLLAAQGLLLADTPETEDGLLTALVAHRRVARTVPLPPGARGGTLAFTGDTLFVGVGSREVVSWPGVSGVPQVAVDMSARDGWRATAADPTSSAVLAAGFSRATGPWMQFLVREGGGWIPRTPRDIGGEPFGAAFTNDGDWVDVFVAAPAAGGATWGLVRLAPARPRSRALGRPGPSPHRCPRS